MRKVGARAVAERDATTHDESPKAPLRPRPDEHFMARARADKGLPPVTLGLALNGGGLRSPVVSSGFLRGLHQIGVLAQCSHVAGVSGGSIAATLLAFSPIELDELLAMDRVPKPADRIPDYTGAAGLERLNGIQETAMHSVLTGDSFKTKLTWSVQLRALRELFLGGVTGLGLFLLDRFVFSPLGIDARRPPAVYGSQEEGVIAPVAGRPSPIITFCMASPSLGYGKVPFVDAMRSANLQAIRSSVANGFQGFTEIARKLRHEHGGVSSVQYQYEHGGVASYFGPRASSDAGDPDVWAPEMSWTLKTWTGSAVNIYVNRKQWMDELIETTIDIAR